ncbi:MAG: hypothetical protein SGJ27_09910 [Candidatus Melainabacteria bacterium]|nr:hypothetical protein [Candidatus Melainabacteria bacterium]
MAVPTVDDRVFCYACNHVTSGILERNRFRIFSTIQSLPKPVLDLVMALTSVDVTNGGPVAPTYSIIDAVQKGLGFSDPMTEGDLQRAAGAVACGNADHLIDEADRLTIKLAHGSHNFHTVDISFKTSTLAVAALSDVDDTARASALCDRLSGPEAKALLELARRGYAPGSFDVDSSMRFVHLSNGTAREGITVDIRWIP